MGFMLGEASRSGSSRAAPSSRRVSAQCSGMLALSVTVWCNS